MLKLVFQKVVSVSHHVLSLAAAVAAASRPATVLKIGVLGVTAMTEVTLERPYVRRMGCLMQVHTSAVEIGP